MRFKKFGNKYIVRIDKGEEIIDTLKNFCKANDIKLGSIKGIGAVNSATIGIFKASTKQYQSKLLVGDYEITNLTGNISSINDEVYLHLHIALSSSSFNTLGGHLNSAVVSGTCEIVIDLIDGILEREFNEDVGLNIYKL